MSKSKWILFSLLGVAILLVLLKFAGLLGKGVEVKVITEKVARRTIVETVNASGKIFAETEVKITPDISGEITELNVHEGNSVRKGQVLAHVSGGIITSPVKGTVILMNVKKGERVVGSSMMAGTEMMRIADLSKLEVRVDVAENDIAKVKLGDSAIVEVDAYNNKKFKGVVTQIASSNNSTSSQTAMSGNDVTSYKVHISLLQNSYADIMDSSSRSNSPFRPGMSASADIQTKTHESRLAVPINAVTTRDKNDTTEAMNYKDEKKKEDVNSIDKMNTNIDDLEEVVFILQNDGTVKKAKVSTDIQDINYIEIVSGLREGDEVITGPYDVVSKTLKNKNKVKVVAKSEFFDKIK